MSEDKKGLLTRGRLGGRHRGASSEREFRPGQAGITNGSVGEMSEPSLDLERKLRPLADPLPAPRPGDWLSAQAKGAATKQANETDGSR